MKINERIIEILREFKINKDDGICYLLSMFYGYSPSYIPDVLKQKVNITGIMQYDSYMKLTWKVPLFEGQQTAWEWVKEEYVPLFKQANPQRGGKVREAVARMKVLFAKNPDVRKEEVLGATLMYLRNTDMRFIRFPHYFIEKGKGVDKVSDLLDWVDKYRNAEMMNQATSKTRIMQ